MMRRDLMIVSRGEKKEYFFPDLDIYTINASSDEVQLEMLKNREEVYLF